MERHQGAYLLQKQLMDAVAADKRLLQLGEDAFRSVPVAGWWAGWRVGGWAAGFWAQDKEVDMGAVGAVLSLGLFYFFPSTAGPMCGPTLRTPLS